MGPLAVSVCADATRAGIDKPFPEAKPAYTIEQAHLAEKEVIPIIEQETGKQFKKTPSIKLVTRQELRDVLRRYTIVKEPKPRLLKANKKKSVHSQSSSDKESRIRSAIEYSWNPFIDYAFGVYLPQNDTVYLLPGNFRSRMNLAGVPAENDSTILKLVVAHELTHALHDQVIGIVPSPDKPDSEWIDKAVTEGFAEFVTGKVAEHQADPQAITRFRSTISKGLVAFPGVEYKNYNEDFRKQQIQTYKIGEEFFKWHFQNGGLTKLWQILRKPPAKRSMIEHPESYSGVYKPGP